VCARAFELLRCRAPVQLGGNIDDDDGDDDDYDCDDDILIYE
jgi:hypothetical protein